MADRITKLQGKSTRPGVYKCKDCRKPFSVTVGTVMERSHLPLSKWVLAAQIMASSKKGFSALQLQRMIGTNYETAWFLSLWGANTLSEGSCRQMIDVMQAAKHGLPDDLRIVRFANW
jgi:transposase-like protein